MRRRRVASQRVMTLRRNVAVDGSRRLGRALALAVALGVPAAGIEAQQTPPQFERARALIERAMREDSLPSITVAVAKDGRVLWAQGFGYADLERRIPATPETMYSLASISKPITATALMRLVEQGRIDLDQPANAYLGEARIHSDVWPADGATVRRVLSHSAGLPLHYEFFYDGETHEPRSTDEGIARYAVLIAPPGSLYQYSNLGYGILDRILELQHGRSYAELMRTEVFEPLGMTHTRIGTGAGLGDAAAVRYGPDNRPVPYYDFDHRGGSAVYSSALDLVRFGNFHLGLQRERRARILGDQTRRLMQQPISAGAASDGYGLGWSILADDHGFRRVSHTGGMPGVSTFLSLYPEENVVVVVLTNRSNGWTGRIMSELAAAVLPGYRQRLEARLAAEEAERSARQTGNGANAGTTRQTIPAALRGRWSGLVRTPDDTVRLTLDVREDGDVHVRLGDALETVLNEVSVPEPDRLVGRFAGTLPDDHAQRHPHNVLLQLVLRDGRLEGQASAQTTGWPYWYALTSPVRLER
ncbi:MAG: beta-lactamase family protein [Candidatus Cloacimonetes bacterium]|nr:beta-lactamase family protein [Candidatus Cloacimonadota bacterium]